MPAQLRGDIRPVSKPKTRAVWWSRLITSSGVLFDVVTPLDYPLPEKNVLLVENRPWNEKWERDPEIELARVESSVPANYGFQLVNHAGAIQAGRNKIGWSYMEAIWSTRMELRVVARIPVIGDERRAKNFFEQEIKYLKADSLLVKFTPNRRERTAETGKWRAIRDIHPKTVKALDQAYETKDENKQRAYLNQADHEFGIEFYALRKRNVWPKRKNVTNAIYPMNRGSAADRKSLGRRKPREKPVHRYLATCWIPKGLADMTAVQLANHLTAHFGRRFSPAQVRGMRKRLQLFVDWEGDPSCLKPE